MSTFHLLQVPIAFGTMTAHKFWDNIFDAQAAEL